MRGYDRNTSAVPPEFRVKPDFTMPQDNFSIILIPYISSQCLSHVLQSRWFSCTLDIVLRIVLQQMVGWQRIRQDLGFLHPLLTGLQTSLQWMRGVSMVV